MAQSFHRFVTLLDKVVELQKVAGWITAHGEFTKTDEVGSLIFCRFDGGEHFGEVALEVADVVVELGESDAHK